MCAWRSARRAEQLRPARLEVSEAEVDAVRAKPHGGRAAAQPAVRPQELGERSEGRKGRAERRALAGGRVDVHHDARLDGIFDEQLILG